MSLIDYVEKAFSVNIFILILYLKKKKSKRGWGRGVHLNLLMREGMVPVGIGVLVVWHALSYSSVM